MNLALEKSVVTRRCHSAGVEISATETLPSGGTRLICTTLDGADAMRAKLRKHLLDSGEKRFPFGLPPGRR